MSDDLNTCSLRLDNVSHNFGELSVLQHLDVAVNRGEFVVLVGPSGCGKTTVLNLLSGNIKPLSGTVIQKGIIRTVYQDGGLFPWLTVSENICMGLRSITNAMQRKQELRDLFDLIHLEEFAHHYPHQLSGGMRQRVELARVLAGDSDILLMDEPFSSLDYQSRLQMRRELVSVLSKRPRTVVFVTHDIEEAAQLADRVLVLTNRPASICHELRISLPHPRKHGHSDVIHAMEVILHKLGLQAPTEPDISNFDNALSGKNIHL